MTRDTDYKKATVKNVLDGWVAALKRSGSLQPNASGFLSDYDRGYLKAMKDAQQLVSDD